jgi:hypothetical protein
MANYKIISDRLNTFFTNNNISIGTSIPTTGTYSRGDIIVNVGPTSSIEPMWICNEGGTPGVWGLVGVGGNGGSGELVCMNETVTVDGPVKEVSLGDLAGLVTDKDKLTVHFNSTHLMQGVDFEISTDKTKIIKLTEGSWNESSIAGSMFAFELLKNVEAIENGNIVLESKLTSITNSVNVGANVNEVEIGVDGFNKDDDTLLVFKNGVMMVEGVDYNISDDNTKIVSIGEVWNKDGLDDYCMAFVVFKEVMLYDGENGSITMDVLGSDVKEVLNNLTETTLQHSEILENLDETYATKDDIANIKPVDITGKQDVTDNNLATTDKTIVGAINELFQSANNGKQLIASAIGEPLNAEDTFSAMSNDINSLLSTFKTNMMNNGVTIESGDKFKALIDKIATLADNEGKGIQIASGHFSVDVLQEVSETMYMGKNRLVFDQPLNFTPDRIILSIPALQLQSLNTYARYTIDSDIHRSLNHRFDIYDEHGNNIIMYIGTVNNHFTSEGLTLYAGKYTSDYALRAPEGIDWLAIGVGEEDTTLRDSLASILGDKGVDVTEEDDMASLISKVDTMSEVRKTKEPYVFFELEGVVHYFHIDRPDEIMTFSFPTGTTNDIRHIGIATCIIDGEEKLISVSKYYTGKIYVADLSNNTTSLYKSNAFVGIGNSNGDIGNIGSSNNGTRTLIYNMGTYAGAYAQSYGPPDYKDIITNTVTGVQGYPAGIAGGFDGTKERLFVSSGRNSIYLDEINPDTLLTIKTNSNASVSGSMACCNRNGNLYIYIYDSTKHRLVEFDSNTLKETGVVITLNNTIPATTHFAIMNVNVIKVVIDGDEYTILK